MTDSHRGGARWTTDIMAGTPPTPRTPTPVDHPIDPDQIPLED